MTAPRDCRPPENTPDGTYCWVLRFSSQKPEIAFWGWGYWLRIGFDLRYSPSEMASAGYTFHSIAEPPHGQ